INVRLLEGSEADSAAILDGGAPRVSFLDLRRATVAGALDWILQPARVTWSLEGGKLVGSSARRSSGQSAWVYDVSAVSLPLEEDLTKLNDYNKAVAESQKDADEFLAAVRTALKGDEQSIVWFAPGQMLVFGTPERQAATATALAA